MAMAVTPHEQIKRKRVMFDIVEFSVRRQLFSIFQRSLQCQGFITFKGRDIPSSL